MELLLMAVVLHALCLSQGGLHTFSLSKVCSGTLRARQDEGWVPVTLKHLSTEEKNVTAEQICRELGCGGLLEFKENRTASINTCLTDCIIRNSTLHNCTAAAASNCSEEVVVECEHQAVRLAAGHDHCAGRVELMDAGRWGSVCDDDWNSTGGNVVCAQLGCGTAVHVTALVYKFGPGTGPIHISKLNCTGKESNLWQCSTQKNEDSNYCGHKEDAGVVCSGSSTVTVSPINTTTPTNWTTGSVTVMVVQESSSSSLSGPVWGCIVLSVALLLVLLSNAAHCKHYKRRKACVIHQRQLHAHSGEDGDINNLQAVTVQTFTTGEREDRRPSLEDDSETSSGSDYEPYQHFGPQSLANMNNLHSLDDAPVVGEHNQAQDQICKEDNALKNMTGDVDSESTSSGECYQNTQTKKEQLLSPDGNQFYPEHSLQTAPFLNTSQPANRTRDVDSESTSSGECYENTQTEQEQLLSPDGNQFYPEHSLQTAPFLNTSQPANRTRDVDSESTSSGECYENTQTEQEQLLSPDGNQFYPEHSLQTAPFLNTSQPANGTHDTSDSDSTSSGECYENIGLEAEAFVQTFEGSPSLPEQNPLNHHTPQPTGNSNLFIPSSPNQDDSSTSSDEAYENVPDIEEENCESSSSSDYDDVANW
ncbi:T-cell differentiation antigen CD6-like isoform X1 [Pygocentrus nattereri]|uniref:T-cell differentiation antigen CD6-like isoform X1 n=1 Tax=Pygocentrus nattereri TaxID=42514 RepID=UPI001890EA81|nr:T-cell differentiation antigen CD6-like isoform X1 [Pygocentrus nattereri]